jgi:hypothetical protein
LLFRAEDIVFAEGKIGLGRSFDISDPARRFFERYANALSWGAGGESESIAFVVALDAIPANIRELLVAEFGFADLFNGNFAVRVQNRFLRSHEIPWSGKPIVAPLIELATRDASGLRCERGTNLQIQGYVRDEVLVRRTAPDAYSGFHLFGLPSPESAAYSLPVKIAFAEREIVIDRRISENTKRGSNRLPRLQTEGDRVLFSHLLLGHEKVPRLPRGIFRTLMRETGIKEDVDEVFDRIVRFNALKFIGLLQALEPYDGDMILRLKRMARFQLEAMAYSIGSREIAPAA